MNDCLTVEGEILDDIVSRTNLDTAVPAALAMLEREPLRSAGFFPGDLLRALIDLPSAFWGRRGTLFGRYQSVVRAGAIARRMLPDAEQRAFWTDVERCQRRALRSSTRASATIQQEGINQ
ncbi:MAG: contact-dependent growth inhibition system immunity protein [Gemmatimonadota bacterium]|nr:contact-dependent growth inhibition system immunity protein [Gemmatimonadota bacterium]